MARLTNISNNLNAVLDTLAWSEGTSTNPATLDDGYDIIVTGIDGKNERFSSYLGHPFSLGRKSKVINSKGLTSNASGRYQFMLRDYVHYRKLLGLYDFKPESQDRWAIQLIAERRALPLIEAGKFREAIKAISNLWASLPGANYKDQRMHSIEKLEKVYLEKGGTLWKSESLSAESSPQSLPLVPPLESVSTKVEPLPMPTIQPKPQPQTQNGLWNLIKKLLKRN